MFRALRLETFPSVASAKLASSYVMLTNVPSGETAWPCVPPRKAPFVNGLTKSRASKFDESDLEEFNCCVFEDDVEESTLESSDKSMTYPRR